MLELVKLCKLNDDDLIDVSGGYNDGRGRVDVNVWGTDKYVAGSMNIDHKTENGIIFGANCGIVF